MSDRFKDALDAITMAMAKDTTTPKKIVRDVFTTHMLLKNIFVINEALTIATEAEQLRKDKEAMKRVLDGARSLLQINSDTIDQLRICVTELEAFIEARGIELP